MVDNGYDISDYENIDPRFWYAGGYGSSDRRSQKEKHLDHHGSCGQSLLRSACLVPESDCRSQRSLWRLFFYLKEGKDGKEPNNWRSYFGGSVWEKLPGQENLYYYHAYAKEQPDLNWENPALRERKSTRWSTGGLTAASQASGLTRSSTLKRPDLGRSSGGRAGRQRLFNQQHHPDAEARRRDENGIGVFFKRIKGTLLLRPHDAFTVGEVFEVDREQLEEFIGEDGYFFHDVCL